MNGTNSIQESQETLRIKGLLQRIFVLRGRIKAVLPSSVQKFRSKAMEEDPSGKMAQLFFQFGTMMAGQDEPVTMGEIGRAMDVPMSTATRIVDWFVQNDYVERLSDPEDRRIVRIAWTEAGKEVYQAIISHALQQIDKLLAHFSAMEREQFVVLLEKFANILEQDV